MKPRGFTLIETLVAVTLLSVAIVAPMTLTARSLAAAFYARDQITAFHLAQEAIESVRHARDHNILLTALGTPTDILASIPRGVPFTVDTRSDTMTECTGACSPLLTNGELYGYDVGWAPSRFTRTVTANFVGAGQDEMRITVQVSWTTGAFQTRSILIKENLYRWVNDNAGT